MSFPDCCYCSALADSLLFPRQVAETAPTLFSYRMLQFHLFWRIALRSIEVYKELLKDLADNSLKEARW